MGQSDTHPLLLREMFHICCDTECSCVFEYQSKHMYVKVVLVSSLYMAKK